MAAGWLGYELTWVRVDLVQVGIGYELTGNDPKYLSANFMQLQLRTGTGTQFTKSENLGNPDIFQPWKPQI